VPCPKGLHRGTYQRLVNEYNRLLAKLDALPGRRLWPHMRKAYKHQFLNRILRIRRRLGLPTPEPSARRWYRISDAALILGVSTKSVLRWTSSGFLRCERAGYGAHRYYAAEELTRVQARLNS
jgi:helix-turn-helix protein